MLRRTLAALVVTAGVAAVAPALPSAAAALPASRPHVMGGSSALGFPGVVALAVFDGEKWNVCTAALVRPRVLATAAHCLTKADSSDSVARVRVFWPGSRAVVYSNLGPRKPAKVRVVKWWRGSSDVTRDVTVKRNDVATVLLGADLGPTPFTRLATQEELVRWRAAAVPVTHVGYGTTGGSRYSPVPRTVDLPLKSLALGSSLGAVFSTANTPTQSVCPGDSGSPAYRAIDAGAVLIGPMAGSSGTCSRAGSQAPDDLGFVAVGFLDLLNTAFAEAGYLTIPSAPTVSGLAARNRDVTVAWKPPVQSPQTVVGYDVLRPDGTVVCQTDQLSCTLSGLPDGSYSFTVRSRNAENEGDAVPASASASVASPPAPPAPSVRQVSKGRFRVYVTTIAGRTSAVVTSYLVRTNLGETLCTLVPPSPTTTQLDCPGPAKRGTYTVSVHAETQMGPSPESASSARFTVR